jgi:hypothetical protein
MRFANVDDLKKYIDKENLDHMAIQPDGSYINNVNINGFTCTIARWRGSIQLTGYVKIPDNHPWFNKDYDIINNTISEKMDTALMCHGWLTYSDNRYPCEMGGSSKVWVIGFDCAHAGDLVSFGKDDPYQSISLVGHMLTMDQYRNYDYVLDNLADFTILCKEAICIK